jgi:hypothetical protein
MYERAPFKLTTELIESLGGRDSDGFAAFAAAAAAGYVALRYCVGCTNRTGPARPRAASGARRENALAHAHAREWTCTCAYRSFTCSSCLLPHSSLPFARGIAATAQRTGAVHPDLLRLRFLLPTAPVLSQASSLQR